MSTQNNAEPECGVMGWELGIEVYFLLVRIYIYIYIQVYTPCTRFQCHNTTLHDTAQHNTTRHDEVEK